ncbi:MAG: response regulator [Ruminococcus sp.]|jgi:signal transduction histidine kinase/CheY-like chemotaxis protein|nr:response regulator [Ruminococcus sp.]
MKSEQKNDRWSLIDALVRLNIPVAVTDSTLRELYHISPELFSMPGIPEYNDEADSNRTPIEWLDSAFAATPENAKQLYELKSEVKAGESPSKIFHFGSEQQTIIRISASHLFADDGERIVLFTYTDLTDEFNTIKLRYEDELSHYKSLINYAFCGIIRYERQMDGYKVVEANDMAAKIAGVKSSEDLFTKGLIDLEKLVYPDDYGMIKTGFDNLLYIGDSFYFTQRIVNIKTKEVCFITGVAVAVNIPGADSDSGKNYIQSTFINTTDRADLEDAKRKLLQLESRLSEAENINRQKNTLLEEVSGNIKTNLNNIVGKAIIAKTRPEKIAENVDSITESAKVVIGLVNNVLDIAMIEERKLFLNETQFEIGEFFENIKSASMQAARAKSQRLNVSYNNIVHSSVIGDNARLETIFTNILSNAVKFTPAGGLISIIVTETSFKHGVCSFSVQISDNGVGMSKEKLMTVLTPYSSRSKKQDEIDGYGLPLANELIKLLGGNIRIESNPGIGTNVFAEIFLKAKLLRDFPDAETEYSFEGKQILLAEDNEISRDMFAELLESEGAFVEKAADGYGAVEIFERSSVYHFDMIFMDIAMPDMDGIEATKRIRAMFRPDARTIPIIALTAKSPGEDVAKGLNFGMDAYEQKPFDMKRIKKLLSVIAV